jgi:hypothetical protein
MRWNWPLRLTAMFGGGALALLTLVLVAFQYGNLPSVSDMGIATGVGTAIGGVLTELKH